MDWYPHDLAAWAKNCSHLTLAERGAYRTLLDWYYTHEKPLPAAVKDTYRICAVRTTQERQAVQTVLKDYFELAPDGWHQKRADEVLRRYHQGLPVTGPVVKTSKASSSYVRSASESGHSKQKRFRYRRAAMFKALRELGKSAPPETSNPELAGLCSDAGVDLAPIFKAIEQRLALVVTVTRTLPVTVTEPVTDTVTPIEGRREVVTVPPDLLPAPLNPERVGEALRVLRLAGLKANGGDPLLLALIEDGVTDQELRLIGAEASAKGKGMAWLAATVRGRRADAARPVKTFRDKADEEHLRRWAPELLKRGPTP